MLAGDFMFALNDAMGKWLLASLSVGQLVFIRSFGMFIILGPMIARQGPRKLFTFEQPLIQFLRVVATAADTALFYAALVTLPLADVMSFYMAGPIYVAALSHFMLGERVGWRRWMAILIGFIGVLIILKPTGTLSAGSLYALIGSIGFGFSIIFSRAGLPTRTLPPSSKYTTEGTRLRPSAPGITRGVPFSTMATRLFVVPRSIPTIRGITTFPPTPAADFECMRTPTGFL